MRLHGAVPTAGPGVAPDDGRFRPQKPGQKPGRGRGHAFSLCIFISALFSYFAHNRVIYSCTIM
ncbi:hypothetical protein, partial [Komagataeibacter intermedius]|uniref:hypothetical protein n=1 Tax=Komagataeibacter intermedius TaxID=66229 RepID=UPI001ADF5226